MTADIREQHREDIRRLIATSQEAREILGFSRQRLNVLVQDGKLQPIVPGIYLKQDLIEFKKAFDEARRNKKWLTDFR